MTELTQYSTDTPRNVSSRRPFASLCISFLVMMLVGAFLTFDSLVGLAGTQNNVPNKFSTATMPFVDTPNDRFYDSNDNRTVSPRCAPISVPVHHDTWGSQKYELLFARAQIPDVGTQAYHGYTIQGLTAFDGRLHLAYGDADKNSGPLQMHAWDPTEKQWIYKGILYTEELRVFREWNGTLYTPETDAHGEDRRRKAVVYQLACGRSSLWNQAGNPVMGSAHNYDLHIVPDSGELMVSYGSRTNESAALVVSQNHGYTWTDLYRRPSPPGAFTRVYFIGTKPDGTIFIWGRVHHADGTARSYAMIRYPDEDSFLPISNVNITLPPSGDPSDAPYLVPIVLGNEMIVGAFAWRPPSGPLLASFRVSGHALVPVPDPWPKLHGFQSELVAWTVDEHQQLLVLMRCCQGAAGIYRTASLEGNPVWEEAIVLPRLQEEDDEYLSFALLLNDLYLGTRKGNLYVVREFYQPVTE